MIMHTMPPGRRAVAYVFPAIILVTAALSTPAFMSTGRIWWLVAILGLPLVLAVVICIEYRRAALGFDASGVHFRSVGYQLHAPWHNVTFDANGDKPILRVTGATPELFPWLSAMYRLLAVLTPMRAARAEAMMTTIPLYAFLSAGDDSVLHDLRANAPAGTVFNTA